MGTKILKVGVAAIVLLAVAAVIIWQQKQTKRLVGENAALSEQAKHERSSQEENHRLAEQLKAATEVSEANIRELMQLRARDGRMGEIEKENARLKNERDDLAKKLSSDSSSPAKTAFPEPTDEQARRRARLYFAKYLALACFWYADGHDDQLPTDLAGLDLVSPPPISWDRVSPSHTGSDFASAVEILYQIRVDQFEFVYRGAVHQLKNPGDVILMKEKLPTERSDGQLEKVYVFCDGYVRFYATSDGNFDAWEKKLTPSEGLTPSSP
jgi:hypothetical protein